MQNKNTQDINTFIENIYEKTGNIEAVIYKIKKNNYKNNTVGANSVLQTVMILQSDMK